MPAGVYVKLVRDGSCSQDLVQRLSPLIKTVLIVVARIKINLQAMKVVRPRKDEWALLLPKFGVQWTAECRANESSYTRLSRAFRQLLDQCRAMCADRGK